MAAGRSNNVFLGTRPSVPLPLLLVLLLSTATLTTDATTSTSTSTSECSAELTACDGDAACSTCLSSAGDENTVSLEDCTARYPEVFVVGSEGSTEGYCESLGAAYCCAFEDSVTAFDCMNGDDDAAGTAAASYWGCLLAEVDCYLEDMPCYGAPATDAPSSAPSPFVAVTFSPTYASVSPSGASMSPTTLGFFSAAPTASPSTGGTHWVEDTPSPTVAINNAPDPVSAGKTTVDTSATVKSEVSSNGGGIARASSPSSVAVKFAATLGLLVVAAGIL